MSVSLMNMSINDVIVRFACRSEDHDLLIHRSIISMIVINHVQLSGQLLCSNFSTLFIGTNDLYHLIQFHWLKVKRPAKSRACLVNFLEHFSAY